MIINKSHKYYTVHKVSLKILFFLKKYFFYCCGQGVVATAYPSSIDVTNISMLTDCVALCLPQSQLYFSTGLQNWPHIIFDLQSDRVVYGIQIYIRTDDPKYAAGNFMCMHFGHIHSEISSGPN